MFRANHVISIASREVARSVRDTRFLGAFTACLILGVGSVFVNAHSYAQKQREYARSTSSYARTIADKARLVGHFHNSPKSVARKPVATQFIALAGEADPDPRAVAKVEYSSWFHGELRKNPLPGLFFPVDLTFVLGLVMALFAFALTYDTLSGEVQRDVLRLMLAGPVSRGSILAGKWLGAVLSLLIPYTVTGAATAAVLYDYAQAAPISTEDVLATAAFFGTGLLYLCTVTSLALMVSVLFRSAGAAMVCLVLVWLVGFVALPYSAISVAHVFVNPPGAASFEHRLGSTGYTSMNSIAEDNLRRAEKRLGEPIPAAIMDLEYAFDEDLVGVDPKLREMIEAIHDEEWRTATGVAESMRAACSERSSQESLVENVAAWLRRISPYGCFLNASVTLANTGFDRELQLREMTQRYLAECVALCRKIGGMNRYIDSKLFPSPALFEVSAATRLARCVPDITGILVMGLLAFLIAYRTFVRREIM